MDTKESIGKAVIDLYNDGASLVQKFKDAAEGQNFQYDYQHWYTQALRVVEILAPDRLAEFKSYYEIDPKRKTLGYGTYVIQDFIKGVFPARYTHDEFDTREQSLLCMFNQITILRSASSRVDSVLANISSELLSDLQDTELQTARQLVKTSLRAAGAVAGVVVENHLQRTAKSRGVVIRKRSPTIGDLNDPLKNASVIDTPTWRKISYLADIRNICTHKKDAEPSKEQVNELIEGANWLVKNVF